MTLDIIQAENERKKIALQCQKRRIHVLGGFLHSMPSEHEDNSSPYQFYLSICDESLKHYPMCYDISGQSNRWSRLENFSRLYKHTYSLEVFLLLLMTRQVDGQYRDKFQLHCNSAHEYAFLSELYHYSHTDKGRERELKHTLEAPMEAR